MQAAQKTHVTIEDIKTILSDLNETDMPFDTPLQVKTSPHHELMKIWGVSVDGNNRLWVRSSRKDELEITDNLIYKNYILGSLNQRLKLLLFFKQQFAK